MKKITKNWDDKIVASKRIDETLNSYDDGELFIEEVFTKILSLTIIKLKQQILIMKKVLA